MAKLTLEQLEAKYELMSEFEKQEFSNGASVIAGIDEAGRGPLAGPVVVASVVLDPNNPILGLDDSKKLSEKKREMLFDEVKRKALAYSIIERDAKFIDEVNILEATKDAMREASRTLGITPDVLLIDAVDLKGVDCKVVPIIKGDAKSNSIAAASILAKVHRDRLMKEYDCEYPGYGFAKHKGYGTKEHYAAIHELGISPIHRMTFLKKMH